MMRPFPIKVNKLTAAFGPPRPCADPQIELSKDYVNATGARAPGSLEARLMRDWLRMHLALSRIAGMKTGGAKIAREVVG